MLNRGDLINYFLSGIKEEGTEKIGTEHEKFVYKQSDYSLLPYSGKVSISEILIHFKNDNWKPIYEGKNIISLQKKGASITLEPGGQLELSGAPLETVHETCNEITDHLEFTKSLEEEMGIGFLGLGFLPIQLLDDVPEVPKKRYETIMRPYMKKLGGLGLDMMHRSCTVQANFDYLSEKDMQKKIRVSSALQPLVTGIFANSPFSDGKLNGYQSYRSFVWSKTDPDRTGILPSMIGKNFSFEEYTDYALNVPVYAIIRDGIYINCLKYSFQDLMNNKSENINAEDLTLTDWIDHLSTIFTEVRLKTYIEMRGADAGSRFSLCALPAFWAGLIYCTECLDESISIIDKWDYQDILRFKIQIAKIGLDAEINNISGWDLAERFISISRKGLANRSKLNSKGKDESIHINYIDDVIRKKETSSLRLINLYNNKWNGDLNSIYSSESF